MSDRHIIDILKNRLHCGKIERGSSPHFYHTDRGNFFVKLGSPEDYEMLDAERKGLELIEETKTVRVPHPHISGKTEQAAYLITEALELRSHTAQSQSKLGRQLAKMHRVRGSEKFGLDFENTIGLTPQVNTWTDSWLEFFREYRLMAQLRMINDEELMKRSEKLFDCLPEFFKGIDISPSLLHGDLWGGNTSALPDGTPVVYDPACYWGHSEADLSMMGMFGGFGREFFETYHEAIPKEPGFDERNKLYQLYHYLNHYLLFGGSYRASCVSIIKNLS